MADHSENYFPKVDSEWYRHRLMKTMLCIVVVFCLLGGRLFYLQIVRGQYFHDISKNNCLRKLRTPPLRGQILDRNGKLLVDNRPAFDLCIIPEDAKPLEQTAEKLSGYIDLSPEQIRERIRKEQGPYGYRTVLLKKDIGRDLMAILLSRRFELPGILIQTGPRRNYIYNPLAAHLIGYLGEISTKELKSGRYPEKRGGDMVGRSGAEKTFETQLSGKPGKKIVQVNATGQVMKVLGSDPPEPGNNVYLTIDFDLQKKAESLLADKTGAAVAMDPSNGDVLAMASSPGFDQSAFINGISDKKWRSLIHDPERPMGNKAIQAEYPPASTYKIVTAMAAMEEGIVNDNTTTYCPGHYRFGNRVFHCWKTSGHGKKNIVGALAQSCDVYFYRVGKQIGVDRLAWYAKACGLGTETGVDLGYEAEGLVPTAAWKRKRTGVPWQAGETLPVAIGQGYNLVTPLQMAVLTAAVGNGGRVYAPRVMQSVQTVEGELVDRQEPDIRARLPASKQTLGIIQKGLWKVVNDIRGTAYGHVRSDHVQICGKTGTAQVVSRKKGAKPQDSDAEGIKRKHLPHAWFVGYAPADNPEIAVSVLIEHGKHGSSGAGPIAKQIIIAYLNKLGHITVANSDSDQKSPKGE
ncbi:MAG: penicillin-binding protein 2 [Thermodesulfobacteriota bacterium]